MSVAAEATSLQRKLFTRWCKQKLQRRPQLSMRLNDIVNDCNDGLILTALIEELSEKKCPDKIDWEKPETSRIKKVAVCNNALKFCYSFVTDVKLKTSAEDMLDGKLEQILGLIWAVMLRFIKIGDDDDDTSKLNAKDALLMWCQNKCQGYPAIDKIDSFKKTSKSYFHNGLALCAIIHKHRPKLIPEMMELTGDAASALKNIAIAQDAAEKYFGLDKFITPTEVTKLDENSMIVFVAEFYMGISTQRKIDLGARRITKLIRYTKENDRLRQEYNQTAKQYKERLVRVEETLNDRTIDNTMAGAKAKLAAFYSYKENDKNVLLGNQLNLEALFNNLAMRLSHHHRPEFMPPQGVTLKDVEAALSHLEIVEQERSVALHAELNRQIKLAEMASQHNSIFASFKKWCEEKEEYLKQRPIIDTVSAAQLQLRLLEGFDKEKDNVRSTTLAHFTGIGAYLDKEKYEHIAGIKSHEEDILNHFRLLDDMSAKRHPVLKDDLDRETFKQQVRLQFNDFKTRFEILQNQWVVPKEQYLTTFVEVHSVEETNVQLSFLELHNTEKKIMGDALVADFKALAAKVLAATYETEYSSYTFEHTVTKDPVNEYQTPEDRKLINDNENFIDEKWALLEQLAIKMKEVLDDHLARESYAAETRIIESNYKHKFKQLQKWVKDSQQYLQDREHVHSVHSARTEIFKLSVFKKDLQDMKNTTVASLFAIGHDLLKRSYKSQLSEYTYEHTKYQLPTYDVDQPDVRAEITKNEDLVNSQWSDMAGTGVPRKMTILEDHLKREEFAVKVRQEGHQHQQMFDKMLKGWIADKEAYLKARPGIDSIGDAQVQRTLFDQYTQEYSMMDKTSFTSFYALCTGIIEAAYNSDLSSYVYERMKYNEPGFDEAKPEMRATLDSNLEFITTKHAELKQLAATLNQELDDALALEQKKEKLRLEFAHQALEYTKWSREACEAFVIEHFGFTLEEVQAYQATVNKSTADTKKTADDKLAEAKGVDTEMTSCGVTSNVYSKLKVSDLEAAHAAAIKAMEARNGRFDTELKRQIYNDNLCKEFASVAEPFSKWITEVKNKITASKEELETQLSFVVKQIEGLTKEASRLEACRAVAHKIEEAKISHIRHTTLTFKDVEVQWAQFKKFLEAKKGMLENEIQNAKLRGITAEQMKEIDDNFKQFDKNNDKLLDRKEFTGCLYSLGEERTGKEIGEIMKQVGDAKGMVSYENFKEFLVHVFGDSDTKDEINNAFMLINKSEIALHKPLENVLPPDDVSYIEATAPKEGDGWSYKKWTVDMFSR